MVSKNILTTELAEPTEKKTEGNSAFSVHSVVKLLKVST